MSEGETMLHTTTNEAAAALEATERAAAALAVAARETGRETVRAAERESGREAAKEAAMGAGAGALGGGSDATMSLPMTPPPTGTRAATPAEELGALVTWGAALFWWAEHEVNPQVATYWDALHYIATSLSVGYANIFPVTPLGKTVGSVVMMVGPALSSRALDGASAAGSAGDVTAALLGSKLDAILDELRRLNHAR